MIYHQIPIVFILFSLAVDLLGQEVTKAEVLASVTAAANHAQQTLIDENGISRCDYNMTEGKWYPYEEPWHTGQVIYGLVEAYRTTGNADYLASARKAGDWWISLEIKDNSNLKGMLRAYHGDDAGQVIVFATVSDGTPGLYQLSKATGDKIYGEVATRAGAWMLEFMCDLPQGVCYDIVDQETGAPITEHSPFHADKKDLALYDVARPNNEGYLFFDMYQFTGSNKYRDAFITLCNSLVDRQDAFGLWMQFMPNHYNATTFHPRFNLWYAESLIKGYELTGDQRYLRAAKLTVDRYIIAQQKSGTIYYKNYLNGSYEEGSICGSSVAFTGLLMMDLLKYGMDENYQERIDLCAHWLVKNQFAEDHPDPNLAGAYLNTRVRNRKGKKWIVNRDVGTSFGLRFLSRYARERF